MFTNVFSSSQVTLPSSTHPININELVGTVYPAASYGISPANADNGALINAAITAISNRGGGTLYFPASSTPYSHTIPIVEKRNVKLVSDYRGAARLLLAANSNCRSLITENLDSLAGGDYAVGTSALVPYQCNLENLIIDGNKANQTVAPAEASVHLYGLVNVINCGFINSKGGGFKTEYGKTVGSLSATSFDAQEECYLDRVFVKNPDGYGWLKNGGHNCTMGSIICQYTRGGWAFEMSDTANASGGVDRLNMVHTYLTTGDTGIKIASFCHIGTLKADGESCWIDGVAGTRPMIDYIKAVNSTGQDYYVKITGAYVTIGHLDVVGHSSATNKTYVQVEGSGHKIHSGFIYNTNTTGSNQGFVFLDAQENNVLDLFLWGFKSSGYWGLYFKNSGGGTNSQYNRIGSVFIENTTQGMNTDNTTDYNEIASARHYTIDTGDVTWNGTRASQMAPKRMYRFGSETKTTSFGGVTGTFDISGTGYKTVNVSHSLMTQPNMTVASSDFRSGAVIVSNSTVRLDAIRIFSANSTQFTVATAVNTAGTGTATITFIGGYPGG